MQRVRLTGTGWNGAPSLNTWYFTATTEDQASATVAAQRVRAAWAPLSTFFPTTFVHTVDPQVDTIDPVTGNVIGTSIVTGLSTLTGTGADGIIMATHTMLLLQMKTGAFLAGRRLQGRSYVGPIRRATADDNGTPNAAAITAINNLGLALIDNFEDGVTLAVWRRPREADDTVTPPVTARPGTSAIVEVVSCPDRFAVLRSRRG